MNWRDFLPLATRLAAGAGEGDWRSAASRAYYAAFHVARDLLSHLGFVVPRADRSHQYLAYRLSNSGDPMVSASGRNLETLRRLRNRSDYDAVPPFPRTEAAASIRLVEDIIQILDAARHEPLLRVYERDVLQDVTWKA